MCRRVVRQPGVTVALRQAHPETLAAGGAAVPVRHVGLGSSLIEEHQAPRCSSLVVRPGWSINAARICSQCCSIGPARRSLPSTLEPELFCVAIRQHPWLKLAALTT